jgi:integrase
MRRRLAWIHADEAKFGRVIAVPLNDAALKVLQAQKGKHRRIVFPYNGRVMAKHVAAYAGNAGLVQNRSHAQKSERMKKAA